MFEPRFSFGSKLLGIQSIFRPFFDQNSSKLDPNSAPQICAHFEHSKLLQFRPKLFEFRWVGHFRSALCTLQIVPGGPLGALRHPREVPGPILDRFGLPWRLAIHQNCLKFDRSSAPISIPEFRSQASPRCAWGRIPVLADRHGTRSMFHAG